MGHVAAQRLRWGDGWIEPGEPVPENEPGRNYSLMVECGQIETSGAAGSARNPIAVAGDVRTGVNDRSAARAVRGRDTTAQRPPDESEGDRGDGHPGKSGPEKPRPAGAKRASRRKSNG